jgi:pyruvate/2-oxoglutarate dehydrogenase complex dihydrolipoamide acyltransferase (E2) component
MARWEFKLPDIGEGVSEGEIVAWAEGVDVGAIVKADQALAEVMTDKATVTITSPKSGKIVELGGKVGQVIAVGSNLIVLDTDAAGGESEAPSTKASGSAQVGRDAVVARPPAAGGAVDPGRAPAAGANLATAAATAPVVSATPSIGQTPTGGNAATAVGDIREDLPGMNLGARPPAPPKATNGGHGGYFSEKPLATPATRKLARDLDVDLRRVPPTGPNGRVTKDDVRLVSDAKAAQAASPAAEPTPVATAAPTLPPAAPAPAVHAREPVAIKAPSPAAQALEERVPLKGMRKKIFTQMARSKQTAAHFTFVEECDVTALRDLRERLKPRAQERGVKLSFLPFIVKAVVASLKRHPELNSAFDESTNEIVRRRYYNIGIATATEAGLTVPVVKDADHRPLLGLAAEIDRLARDARENKIKLEDLQGSTFTITSLGQQGGLFATPILNFPEVGILGVHQMKQKPVVRDGQIVIGEVMLLSLSFDHRVIDGHVGAAFAYEVIRFLENPDDLFLETLERSK